MYVSVHWLVPNKPTYINGRGQVFIFKELMLKNVSQISESLMFAFYNWDYFDPTEDKDALILTGFQTCRIIQI